ncbi:MAG: DUF3465 domain-containing protein [Pseudomonadota bacterium]
MKRKRKTIDMQKILIALAIFAIGYVFVDEAGVTSRPTSESADAESILEDAFANRRSDLQVHGSGEVTRVLPDDTEGSRHQRFILRLQSGQTLLVAHNIDLAPRVSELSKGDMVEFYGEYEWTEQGGVIHWTHHDPQKRHVGGWIKHQGRTYQ